MDHFIPWWRYPADLGHNFALAHAECSRKKSDHLAAEFDGIRTRHDLQASWKIARWQVDRRRGCEAHARAPFAWPDIHIIALALSV